MSRALLQSKLHPPRIPQDFVHRPRLDAFLTKLASARVFLLVAPAGYGKSTLAASWLAQAERNDRARTAWLTLDSSDNDLITFWSYLTAAIEHAFPDACPQTRHLLATPNMVTPSAVSHSLAVECQSLPKRLMVVIDEYDWIEDERVHTAMHAFIRFMPDTIRLIITARAEPHAAFGLMQMRMHGRVVEVRTSDLQFNASEVDNLFKETHSGPNVTGDSATDKALVPATRAIPSDVAEAFRQHVEGWAAGLRMAAISLQGRDEPGMRAYAREFSQKSNRYVVDYLIDHVLAAQPAHVQWFLLRSSLLPRFSAQLCAAALGDMPLLLCQQIIETLDRSNLFIVNLDEHRGWYRYHPQFRLVLEQRLRASLDEAGMSAIRRKAGEWFAAHGEFEAAIQLLIDAREYAAAASMLTQTMVRSDISLEWTRFERWLLLFPGEYIDINLGLALTRAWVMAVAVPQRDASQAIRQAERLLDMNTALPARERDTWRSHVQILRSIRKQPGLPNWDMLDVDEAIRLLPQSHTWPRTFARTIKSHALLLTGRGQEAQQNLLDAIAAAPDDEKQTMATLHFTLAYITFYCGHINDTFERSQQLLDIAQDNNDHQKMALALSLMGQARYQQGDMHVADSLLALAFDTVEPWDTETILLNAYQRAWFWALTGNADASSEHLDRLHRWAAEWGNADTERLLAACDANHAAHFGDKEAAMRWARGVKPDIAPHLTTADIEVLTLAKVLMTVATPASLSQADDLLDKMHATYKAMHIVRYQLQVLVWQAWTRQARGNVTSALDALEEAVALGQPRGYVQWFINGGAAFEDMLHTLVQQNRHAREASALLRTLDTLRTQPNSSKTDAVDPYPHDLLTEREAEVLKLLAEHLTNKDIAQRLKLSPITVRNHANNIYAKLGVKTRREAVKYARARGLVL